MSCPPAGVAMVNAPPPVDSDPERRGDPWWLSRCGRLHSIHMCECSLLGTEALCVKRLSLEVKEHARWM